MCEVISCDKRGKGRLHISETFPTFFWTGIWVVVVVVVFLLEREGWMAPAHGHHQKKGDYLNWDKIITQPALYYQVFFVRAWVSVSLVPRRSLLICCPREVSVTSQLMVESRNDRAENAWGLGWVSVLSNWFKLGLSLSKSEPVNRPCSGYRHAYRWDDFFGSKQTVRTQTCVLGC